jgi:hypothetical protein
VKVEQRLTGGGAGDNAVSGISASFEPSTSAAQCANVNTARGFVPTPKQFGFDLFKTWRF